MQAIQVHQFGDPEELRAEEIPCPVPGAEHVLVRIEAAGVNPVDTYIRAGTYGTLPALPYTPGLDAAGTVVSTGAAVRDVQPGQRVYLAGARRGTYAAWAVADLSEIHPLPDSLSFAEGAAIGIPYPTAHRALFGRGGGRPGESVLVHGASGGVGLAAVQLAHRAGMTVYGTAGTQDGSRLALESGARAVFDHHDPHHPADLLDATGGRGFDLIIEMLANCNLGHDLEMLAPHGRVVVVGSRGEVSLDPRATMVRDADIRGMILMNATPEELAAIHQDLATGFASGALQPVIARSLPLESAHEAHRAVMAPGALGKLVLVPPHTEGGGPA